MQKPSVYIETTIFSYLASKPSKDLIIAGHQQITHEWWQDIRPKYDCYISAFVVQEIERGDEESAKRRLSFINEATVLRANEEIRQLAAIYFEILQIPSSAKLMRHTLPWHRGIELILLPVGIVNISQVVGYRKYSL
ncbi:MAG: hypothetical protein HY960_07645 [Ignavibacteriae bacterium]|nr:hypothetical protein [Ignavibacteriota bacterium]